MPWLRVRRNEGRTLVEGTAVRFRRLRRRRLVPIAVDRADTEKAFLPPDELCEETTRRGVPVVTTSQDDPPRDQRGPAGQMLPQKRAVGRPGRIEPGAVTLLAGAGFLECKEIGEFQLDGEMIRPVPIGPDAKRPVEAGNIGRVDVVIRPQP